jgi:hypothetical protein
MPGGIDPELTLYVYVAVPPVEVRVWLGYAVPTTPAGIEAGLTVMFPQIVKSVADDRSGGVQPAALAATRHV